MNTPRKPSSLQSAAPPIANATWQSLYALADALYALTPWEFLEETDLIALRHPETGRLAYLSVMGSGGEHFSLAIYLGEDSLGRFHLIQALADEDRFRQDDFMALTLENRHLQVSFETRQDLHKDDLTLIKKLNRRYRGSNWPLFRSYHAGYEPGPLDAADAAWAEHALTQLLDLTPRLRDAAVSSSRGREPKVAIIGRELHDGAWRDFYQPLDPTPYAFPAAPFDAALLAKVKALPRSAVMLWTLKLLPNPVGLRFGERTFPYLLMGVDPASGFMLGMELLSVETQPHEQLLASIPDTLLRLCLKNEIRPAALTVAGLRLEALLKPAATALGITLTEEDIPGFDEMLAQMPF